MTGFASELAHDIQATPKFWSELAMLRAAGIGTTLSIPTNADPVPDGVLNRLLSTASIFAQADDDASLDLAQQIAVFGALCSNDQPVQAAAAHILSGLGNFPGLKRVVREHDEPLPLQIHLRSALLEHLNKVSMAGKEIALTEFQLGLWETLKVGESVAVSAPTSAGKSFVIQEYMAELAQHNKVFCALYIAPTRALLAEVQGKLERRLVDSVDSLRVTTVPIPDQQQRPRQIYVLTQERAQLLLATIDVRELFDLIVVDEAQAIGDESRGIILHDVLEKLRVCNPRARFLFLAPGAIGFEAMGQSIGLDALCVQATTLSPVVQNRISVQPDLHDAHMLELSLVTPRGKERIGALRSERGFQLTKKGSRLAAVARALGAGSRSLVYATGPSNAEELARLLCLDMDPDLVQPSQPREELAAFIEEHIHKDYSLAKYVRRGIAFHYGQMPRLLRETIENVFRAGQLDFLCCTTTLFQGINLPARNVFIDTPTRGNRKEPLDEAALWNFAGRAGRLGEEVVGNVFLVDYDNWDSQPLTAHKPFALKIAFREALVEEFASIVAVLDRAMGANQPSEVEPSDRSIAAAGLALFRQSQHKLEPFLARPALGLSVDHQAHLVDVSRRALAHLDLPESVLQANWSIDPLALSRLLVRLREKIRDEDFDDLIPLSPAEDCYNVYAAIFFRMYRELGGATLAGPDGKRLRGFVSHVTVVALKWMRGAPIAQLVSEHVSFGARSKSSRDSQKATDTAIRGVFELIEQTIRFKLVQWGKAYVDLLKYALEKEGRPELIRNVYDFSLALELGVSSATGRSLVELGLSRISAASIAALILDSAMTASDVRAWLRRQPEDLLQLSPVILTELREKGLLGGEESLATEAAE